MTKEQINEACVHCGKVFPATWMNWHLEHCSEKDKVEPNRVIKLPVINPEKKYPASWAAWSKDSVKRNFEELERYE